MSVAGVILFAADDSIVASDAGGEWWLARLGRAELAAVTRNLGESVLIRAPSGPWLVARASELTGCEARTAVTIEPARGPELAAVVADTCELTRQERVITQLVAEGLTTQTIARRLHVSPWTVQDHLKSIFEKVGVHTRGELVARVFFTASATPAQLAC